MVLTEQKLQSFSKGNLLHLLLLIGLLSPAARAQTPGTFIATGNMTIGRNYHTATLLNNGRVLIAGGYGRDSAELYDPSTGTFTATGNMTTNRWGHTATLLNNGRVLIAGGSSWLGGGAFASAELYDPSTGTFTATGNMTTGRHGHTATLLNNGRVLIAGGSNFLAAELYDPSTGIFTATGNMTTVRGGHTATLLNNGRVLIAGGYGLASADLYDPSTGTFTATGNMATARLGHRATLLRNGQVLVAGGATPFVLLANAELYDPSTGNFSPAGSMTAARASHTATQLSNGKVLIAGGGFPHPAFLATAELYDLSSGSFTATGSMTSTRGLHTATLLPTGKVMVAGGLAGSAPGPPLASAELYTPVLNRPPVADAGANQTAECRGPSGATVTLDGSRSSDPDGDTLSFVWKDSNANVVGSTALVTLTVPLGIHTFTLTVDDGKGGSASASVMVTVPDTAAPALSVSLTPDVLWPPKHQLVQVTASIRVNDSCDGNPMVVLVSIASNEPDNGLGDGDTPGDIQGAILNTDDRSFSLRAERSGLGDGRRYTVTYRARDAAGNTTTAAAQVMVPLNQKP